MRLFSYKMTHDTGFAPNPFWGYLTLATCKPGIRRTKVVGDWIAGFTSGKLCGDAPGQERLVFLMQVDERLSIAEYFRDPRFAKKIPVRRTTDHRCKVGDNIYRPTIPGAVEPDEFEQVPNISHRPSDKTRDVGGRFVLVAKRFVYCGREAIALPAPVRPDVPHGQSGSGQQTRDRDRVEHFVEYVRGIAGFQAKVLGLPHQWPEEDAKQVRGCGTGRKNLDRVVQRCGATDAGDTMVRKNQPKGCR